MPSYWLDSLTEQANREILRRIDREQKARKKEQRRRARRLKKQAQMAEFRKPS